MTKKPKLKNIHLNKTSSKIINIPDKKNKSTLDIPRADDSNPSISLKYIDMNFKSFSDLKNQNNLKKLDNFVKNVNNSTDWDSVFKLYKRTPTTHNRIIKKKLKKLNMDANQLGLFHLRLSDKFRVHGFRLNNRFKLVWLDPNHEIDKL